MRISLTSALTLGVLALAATAAPLSASAYTHKVLYSFCAKASCADGKQPSGALVEDAAGNLYGVTDQGGALGQDGFRHGTAYELIPNATHTRWTHRVLHLFCRLANCSDGDGPQGALILDASGNLYGTTPYGGATDSGVVFRLSPTGGTWKYSVLHRFCTKADCPDGWAPFFGLTYAGAATGAPYDGTSPLYGTTSYGGKFISSHGGVVFEIAPDQATGTWRESVLYNFCADPTCHPSLPDPSSGVTVGPDGTLYGALAQDGFPGNIYSLLPPSDGKHWTERTEHTFCAQADCADGEFPLSDPLVLDDHGNLFGTTLGTLFEIKLANRLLTTLHQFCELPNCLDGSGPRAGVLRSPSGDLFGVTSEGGANSDGTLFVLHDGTYQVLYDFCSETNCKDGSDPEAALITDGSGVMYGVSMGGGAHFGGTVFEEGP